MRYLLVEMLGMLENLTNKAYPLPCNLAYTSTNPVPFLKKSNSPIHQIAMLMFL